MWMKICNRLLCCGLTAALFTACGTEAGQKTAANPDQLYYHFQETVLPYSAGISGVFEQEYVVSGDISRLCGDTLYRLIRFSTVEEPFLQKNYIQLLKPPYQEWETEEADSGGDVPVSILGEAEGRLILLMRGGTQGKDPEGVDGNDPCTYYLARWQPGMESMERVSESGYEGEWEDFSANGEFFLTSAGEVIGFHFEGQGTVSIYDAQFHLKEKRELGEGAQISGILEEPESGRLLWYGAKDSGTGVFSLEGDASFPEGDVFLEGANAGNLHGVYDADGVLYLADNRTLWRVTKGEPETVCRFQDRNYPMSILFEMTALDQGGLLLHSLCTDEIFLRIEGNHEPLPEKQEIIIASSWPVNTLDLAVGKFNRTSEQYSVKIQYPYDPYGEEPADIQAAVKEFYDRLQMEISAGRGPDLFLSGASNLYMDIPALAREGYLQNLDGVLEDEEDFWPAAMEMGRMNGVQYGLPYEGKLRLTSYSRDLTGERESFTLPELMETVRNSGVEVLQWGYDGTSIVMYYGLYDNDNRDFIDWETGQSHLKEKPFREFLEFAGKYADPVIIDTFPDFEAARSAVAEGKVFAVDNFMEPNWGTIWGSGPESLKTIFQGKVSCIGYPRSRGNGIYVAPELFFMNVNSDRQEGAKEFLRFLLSKENQRLLTVDSILGNRGQPPRMPVRLSVLEESIETAMERKERGETGDERFPALTREEAQEARFLIENARPASWKVSEIEDIFYEELPLYFDGQRSLDETVEILDNRVQLFLDENWEK